MNSPFSTTYFWISLALSIPFLIYLVYQYITAARYRPKIQKGDVIFEERFASGNSLKNILTRIGGARNCLRLVVTKDLLWVTSWFPFSLLTTFYDLEHVILRSRISKIEPDSGRVLLTFADERGVSHSLMLRPKNSANFLTALNKN